MRVITVLATISCARAFVVRGSALNTVAGRQISSSSIKMVVGSVTPQVGKATVSLRAVTIRKAALNLLTTAPHSEHTCSAS
eukprot:4730-Heterococcus_DN1.PRE.2